MSGWKDLLLGPPLALGHPSLLDGRPLCVPLVELRLTSQPVRAPCTLSQLSPPHVTVSPRRKPVNFKCPCEPLDLARKTRWDQFLFQVPHCQVRLHSEPRGGSQASSTLLPTSVLLSFLVLVSACVVENRTVLFLCQRDLMLVCECQMSLTGSCL